MSSSILSPVYRRPKDDKSTTPNTNKAIFNVNELNVTEILDDVLTASRSTTSDNDTASFIDIAVDVMAADTVNVDSKEDDDSKMNSLSAIVSPKNRIEDILTVFRYIKRIGDGGSCQVFKAQHKENGKLYALKKMSQDDEPNLKAFQRERKMLRKMVHPSIVSYFDSYVDNDSYYIVTHYADGMSHFYCCWCSGV